MTSVLHKALTISIERLVNDTNKRISLYQVVRQYKGENDIEYIINIIDYLHRDNFDKIVDEWFDNTTIKHKTLGDAVSSIFTVITDTSYPRIDVEVFVGVKYNKSVTIVPASSKKATKKAASIVKFVRDYFAKPSKKKDPAGLNMKDVNFKDVYKTRRTVMAEDEKKTSEKEAIVLKMIGMLKERQLKFDSDKDAFDKYVSERTATLSVKADQLVVEEERLKNVFTSGKVEIAKLKSDIDKYYTEKIDEINLMKADVDIVLQKIQCRKKDDKFIESFYVKYKGGYNHLKIPDNTMTELNLDLSDFNIEYDPDNIGDKQQFSEVIVKDHEK